LKRSEGAETQGHEKRVKTGKRIFAGKKPQRLISEEVAPEGSSFSFE
jgi:hypothetical protein